MCANLCGLSNLWCDNNRLGWSGGFLLLPHCLSAGLQLIPPCSRSLIQQIPAKSSPVRSQEDAGWHRGCTFLTLRSHLMREVRVWDITPLVSRRFLFRMIFKTLAAVSGWTMLEASPASTAVQSWIHKRCWLAESHARVGLVLSRRPPRPPPPSPGNHRSHETPRQVRTRAQAPWMILGSSEDGGCRWEPFNHMISLKLQTWWRLYILSSWYLIKKTSEMLWKWLVTRNVLPQLPN